ncbi:TPA: hypothetical protein DDZ86_01615 [Candidatus Dependentiae bacterium]|nr:MAG: hypothetical protein UW09_C0001G0313 [candidate division TM6 bacterium GW2011_GWF2_43_87]HBL98322.1 hypothetical protein [Candidatus Dependentiae bacterium]
MKTNKNKTNKKLLYTLAVVLFATPSLRAMQFGNCPTSSPVELFTLLWALYSLQQNNLINTQPVLEPQTNPPSQQTNISLTFNGPTNIILNQTPPPTTVQPEFSRFSTTNTPQAYNTQRPLLNLDYSEFCTTQPDQPIISNQIIDTSKKRTFSQFSPPNMPKNQQYKIRGLNTQQNGPSQPIRCFIPTTPPCNQNAKKIINLTTPSKENNSPQQSTFTPTSSEEKVFEKALEDFKHQTRSTSRHLVLRPYFTSKIERPEYIIQLLSICSKPALAIKILNTIEYDLEDSLFNYAVTHRSVNFLEKIIDYIISRINRCKKQSCTNNMYESLSDLITKGAELATKKNRTDMATLLNQKADELKKNFPPKPSHTPIYCIHPSFISLTNKRTPIQTPKTKYLTSPEVIKNWVLSNSTKPLVFYDPLNKKQPLNTNKTIEALIKTTFHLGYRNAFEFATAEGSLETLTLLLKIATDLLANSDLKDRLYYYSMVITALNKSKFFAHDFKKLQALSDTIFQLKTASDKLLKEK